MNLTSPLRQSQNRIATVVVTYNRASLLKECLKSLVQQTLKLDKVFVIDNCSTDETSEVAKEFEDSYPGLFSYLRQNENLGGAGGFHVGVKTAFEQGYDWIWLMDDDVEVYPDALEKLLQHAKDSKCIHGQRVSTNGTPFLWEGYFHASCGFVTPYADRSFKAGRKTCEVNFGCFEGMLIHRSIVEKIGFPDSRFFIAWDDTIYGFLASKHTRVLYVEHPVIIRKRKLKSLDLGFRSLPETSDLYRFYHMRNRGLVKEYLSSEPSYRPWLFDLVTMAMALKEYLRAILIQRDFTSIKSILRGYRASYQIPKRTLSK